MNAEKYGYYLWLVMLYGTADPKIHKAIEKYGSAKNVYDAIIDGDISTLDRDERERLRLRPPDRQQGVRRGRVEHRGDLQDNTIRVIQWQQN